MAGTILAGGIRTRATSGVRFGIATEEEEDPEIRRLLRENPMAGAIAISLEREPDYFADANLPGEEKQTIIARENGRIVCIGSCSIRSRFVNGQPRRVGYLGGLRLDASVAGRSDIVRRGYEFFRELQQRESPDFFFTSIAADNERARQFLERGLPGMPKYQFVGEFVTLLMPASRSRRREKVDGQDQWKTPPPHMDGYESFQQLIDSLNENNCRYQFAPRWTVNELAALERIGLRANEFSILIESGRISASAALWDQRRFKQTVIRGYESPLSWARLFINFAARIARRPGLPAVGATLSHATVSHLVAEQDEPSALVELITVLRSRAAERQIDFLTLGFAADDPRLKVVLTHFKSREYRSRLYVVRWPETPCSAADLDRRTIQPELALL